MTARTDEPPARRHRVRVTWVSLMLVVAALGYLAAADRAAIKASQQRIAEQQTQLDRTVADLAAQQAELDRQRHYDCLLFAARAYQRLPPDAGHVDRCLVVGAAAAVDNAGCLGAGPVRPDLDTSAQAQSACLALLAGRGPPAPPAPGPSPAPTTGR